MPILDNLTSASTSKESPQTNSQDGLKFVGQSVPMKTAETCLVSNTPVGYDAHVLTVNSVRAVEATQSTSTSLTLNEGKERTRICTDVSTDEISENVRADTTVSTGTGSLNSRKFEREKDSVLNGDSRGTGGHEEGRDNVLESHEKEKICDAVYEEEEEEEEGNREEEEDVQEEEIEVEENYEDEDEDEENDDEKETEGLEIEVDDNDSHRRDKKYFTGSYYESDNSDVASKDRERARARTADSEGTVDDYATARCVGLIVFCFVLFFECEGV